MNSKGQLADFIHHIASDDRLTPVHIALAVALCAGWIKQQFSEKCTISRKEVMRKAHIRSTATYHKAIRGLQELGYLEYRPSYHPRRGSLVALLLPLEMTSPNRCRPKGHLKVVPHLSLSSPIMSRQVQDRAVKVKNLQ